MVWTATLVQACCCSEDGMPRCIVNQKLAWGLNVKCQEVVLVESVLQQSMTSHIAEQPSSACLFTMIFAEFFLQLSWQQNGKEFNGVWGLASLSHDSLSQGHNAANTCTKHAVKPWHLDAKQSDPSNFKMWWLQLHESRCGMHQLMHLQWLLQKQNNHQQAKKWSCEHFLQAFSGFLAHSTTATNRAKRVASHVIDALSACFIGIGKAAKWQSHLPTECNHSSPAVSKNFFVLSLSFVNLKCGIFQSVLRSNEQITFTSQAGLFTCQSIGRCNIRDSCTRPNTPRSMAQSGKIWVQVGVRVSHNLVWFGKSPPVWMGFLPKPFCPHHWGGDHLGMLS